MLLTPMVIAMIHNSRKTSKSQGLEIKNVETLERFSGPGRIDIECIRLGTSITVCGTFIETISSLLQMTLRLISLQT